MASLNSRVAVAHRQECLCYWDDLPMQYKVVLERRKSWPFDAAGDARKVSLAPGAIWLNSTSLNVLPGSRTETSPRSF